MHLAAEKGKHLRLRNQLKGNLNALSRPDSGTKSGRTALALAASNGHARCMKMLLDAKADVNALCFGGISALMVACEEGQLEALNILIEARACIDKVDLGHYSALHIACERPAYHPLVKALLDAGAKTTASVCSESALGVAVKTLANESVKLLIAAKADLYGSEATTSPLSVAVMNNNVEAVAMLLEAKADINAFKPEDGRPPLHSAIFHGCVDSLHLLISKGADLKSKSKVGTSVMHVASQDNFTLSERTYASERHNPLNPPQRCRLGTPEEYAAIMKALIDAKADVHVKTIEQDQTPMMTAAGYDNVPAIQALLGAGALITDKNNNGLTPIHIAAMNGSCKAIRALVEAKADVNECTTVGGVAGITPMIIALRCSQKAAMQTLLQCGAHMRMPGSS
jgi:ankyrin repeat protein